MLPSFRLIAATFLCGFVVVFAGLRMAASLNDIHEGLPVMAAHAAPVSIAPAADREARRGRVVGAGDVRPALRRQHRWRRPGPGCRRRCSIARRRRCDRAAEADRPRGADAAPRPTCSRRTAGRGRPAARVPPRPIPTPEPSSAARALRRAAEPEVTTAALAPTCRRPQPRPRRATPPSRRSPSPTTPLDRRDGRTAAPTTPAVRQLGRRRPSPQAQPKPPSRKRPSRKPRNRARARQGRCARQARAHARAAPRSPAAQQSGQSVRRQSSTLPRASAAALISTLAIAPLAKARSGSANSVPCVPLSVLDLSPVTTGISGPQALRNSIDLGRLADRLGFTRYWVAEHHNMPNIASSAPDIMIGQIAAATAHHARRLRRRDAAEPRAAAGRRALQGAGGTVSRPHRSRPRPRAGHRSGDLLRAAAPAGRSGRRRFPRPLPGAAGVRAAAVSGEPSVSQGQCHAGRRAAAAALSARLARLQRAARRPRRRRLLVRASFLRFRSGRTDDDLSRAVQAVGDAGQAAGDPRRARGLRRHRRRGGAARDLGRSRTSRCGGRAATSRSRARRKPRRTATRRPTAR